MENNQDNNNTGNPQSLGRQSNPAAGDIATASTQVNNQDNKPVNNDGDTAPGTVTASDTRRTAPDTAPDTHRDTPTVTPSRASPTSTSSSRQFSPGQASSSSSAASSAQSISTSPHKVHCQATI